MKDSIGYIINDGKSYTRGHSSARLVHLRLLPDIGNVPLMVLRDSAAEALQQHLHKVREAGGTELQGYGLLFSLRASSAKLRKPQAASCKRRAASCKLQAASGKLPNIFSLVKFPVSSSERLY